MLLPEDKKLQMIFENTVRLIETQEHDRDVIAFYQLRAKEAIVPLTLNEAQEQQGEEKRKQDEEDAIFAGKWVIILPKTMPNVKCMMRLKRYFNKLQLVAIISFLQQLHCLQ